MFAWQFMEYQSIAKRNGWPQFISMQNYYCASYREEEREMMPCIKKMGISSLPWSPIVSPGIWRCMETVNLDFLILTVLSRSAP
jgi:aryl-alcohol dehydrogenase-like predicted oxidoreductase